MEISEEKNNDHWRDVGLGMGNFFLPSTVFISMRKHAIIYLLLLSSVTFVGYHSCACAYTYIERELNKRNWRIYTITNAHFMVFAWASGPGVMVNKLVSTIITHCVFHFSALVEAYDVTVFVMWNELDDTCSIPWQDCVSLHINDLGKGMNPNLFFLAPAMDKL